MMKLPVYNREGKETESIEIPEGVFSESVNQDVIHQALVMYQANLRAGTASTKERGAVSGGGKKPWRQKGTGRARAGSSRSPLWHKGGIVFGPHPRDFGYEIPQKVKVVALRESLNSKYLGKDILCVELEEKLLKTKEFVKVLANLKLNGKILALLDDCDPSVLRVSQNIPYFNIMRAIDINAYDVLKSRKVLVTKSAFKNLIKRIQKRSK